MLTKTDVKIIKDLLREEIEPLKQDVSGLKQDMSTLKQDIEELKEISEFTKNGVINLLDWSDDIHKSVVKQDFPEKLKRLKQ